MTFNIVSVITASKTTEIILKRIIYVEEKHDGPR